MPFAEAQELRKERAKIVESARKLMESAQARPEGQRAFSRDEERRFNLLHEKAAEMKAQIERIERQVDTEADLAARRLRAGDKMDGPGPEGEPRFADLEHEDSREVRALRKDESCVSYLRSRGKIHAEERGEERLSFGRFIRALALGPRSEAERRALGESSDSTGGYSVPAIVAAELIDRMRPLNQVLSAGARLVPVESDSQSFAKVSADPTPSWRLENIELAETEPTFTRVLFQPKTVAWITRASRELLEDSVNLAESLPQLFAKTLAAELDRVALVGSGTDPEPAGIAAMSSVTEVSMGANGAAVTDYSKLVELVRDVLAANGPQPTDAIMSPRTWAALANLQDLNNNPLAPPPAIASLKMRPTSQVPNDQSQGTASNASSVYVGNFSELWIGFRPDLFRVEVLKERYADFLQYGFLCFARFDVQSAHEEALGRLVGITP